MEAALILLSSILGLIVLGFVIIVMLYNRLVALRTRCEAAWSDIAVQLKRRYNLIPNLVETVKGYAAHEKDTLEAVIEARNKAVSSTGPADEQAASEGVFTAALGRLIALSEDYPELRADKGFANLQGELSELEEVIQMARRYYNGCVKEYNVKVESMPSHIIATMFQFKKKSFFELPANDPARQVPEVKF